MNANLEPKRDLLDRLIRSVLPNEDPAVIRDLLARIIHE
jgi:hypothetical protein